jgi:heme A synthase
MKKTIAKAILTVSLLLMLGAVGYVLYVRVPAPVLLLLAGLTLLFSALSWAITELPEGEE